jgi:hypothetical protein
MQFNTAAVGRGIVIALKNMRKKETPGNARFPAACLSAEPLARSELVAQGKLHHAQTRW